MQYELNDIDRAFTVVSFLKITEIDDGCCFCYHCFYFHYYDSIAIFILFVIVVVIAISLSLLLLVPIFYIIGIVDIIIIFF